MGDIQRLLDIMARLRDRDGGCPWDREQDFSTVAPYTIEEAYEVDDAIRRGDHEALRDELGDLLFQVAFHAQMAREAGLFGFGEVVSAICDKMVRRHPHVFGDAQVKSAAAQTRRWEEQKALERSHRADRSGDGDGALDGIPVALPALSRSAKLQRRAARVGFDWPVRRDALGQLEAALGELRKALEASAEKARLARELGDCLLAVVGVARRLGVDPEAALRDASGRFEGRFRSVESALRASGRTPRELDAQAWLALWERAEREESG